MAQERDVVQQQQQRQSPVTTFFQSLFGGQRSQRARQPEPTQPAQPQRQRAPRGAAPQRSAPRATTAAPAAPQPEAVEKDPDARQVWVFGDFFASGLSNGLERVFADSPMFVVRSRSDASSGLVRDDHFDWPAALERYLDDPDRQVDIAVIMIGGNDRQAIRQGGEHALRSERWREIYIERIDRIIGILAEHGVPAYWVGLPPVQSGRMSQDYAHFNDMYRERADRANSHFVDVWSSFADEDGRYAIHGPDINGEQRQLRREDGLNFTPAGNTKLAHFVARDIRRDIGRDDDQPVAALPTGPVGPEPFRPGEEEQETGIGQVVTLTGAGDGAAELAGGPEPTPEPPDDSVFFRTILLGESPEPRAGRSDDFSWPREGNGEE